MNKVETWIALFRISMAILLIWLKILSQKSYNRSILINLRIKSNYHQYVKLRLRILNTIILSPLLLVEIKSFSRGQQLQKTQPSFKLKTKMNLDNKKYWKQVMILKFKWLGPIIRSMLSSLYSNKCQTMVPLNLKLSQMMGRIEVVSNLILLRESNQSNFRIKIQSMIWVSGKLSQLRQTLRESIMIKREKGKKRCKFPCKPL